MIRTRANVILDDAAAPNLFAADAFVQQRRPRSVLCLPLIKQTKLVGVLYLENNLTPHAFTSDRIAVLELLASQAAISLENADLYSDLQQENIDRRRAEAELQRSEAFLAEGQRISHTGSWGWNLSTGKLVWSEEHCRIFGFDLDRGGTNISIFPKPAPSGGSRSGAAVPRPGHSREERLFTGVPDPASRWIHQDISTAWAVPF